MDRLRYLTKARVYLLEGKYQKAYGLLQKMSYYAEKQKRIFIRMEVLVLLAVLQRRLGRETWKETLQTAISQAEGFSTEQIARSLKISQSTVKYHSKETYRKLGVSGKTAAVNEARNRKMI